MPSKRMSLHAFTQRRSSLSMTVAASLTAVVWSNLPLPWRISNSAQFHIQLQFCSAQPTTSYCHVTLVLEIPARSSRGPSSELIGTVTIVAHVVPRGKHSHVRTTFNHLLLGLMLMLIQMCVMRSLRISLSKPPQSLNMITQWMRPSTPPHSVASRIDASPSTSSMRE